MYAADPEYAYLDLVTCGEILQSYYTFTDEELYPAQTRTLFEQIVVK